MWRKFVQWYQEWEREQMAVLACPSLASRTPLGYRRFIATGLAQLSEIERQQLADFSLKYKGSKIWIPVAWMALAFSVTGLLLQLALAPNFPLHKALIGANAIGFTCLTMWIGAWFNYRQLSQRMVRALGRTILLAIVGGLFGFVIAMLTGDGGMEAELHKIPRIVGIIGVGSVLLLGVPMMLITIFRNRQYASLTAALQRDAEQDRLARALSETQLRLLRAQIEPHFLFNTLGAVQQLAEQGAPRAAELTANLIAFLRASLDEMRSDTVTLADDFKLIDAYLRVMHVRLGSRLRFTLVLPTELAQLRLPSMLLLTLVENAIKHGIEPALRGGEVTVSAEQVDGMLHLRVEDSGIGLQDDVVDGTGLSNARRRLELAHPGTATLSLSALEDGTLAEIALPVAP
ncbi:sensor histidine kinase [Massilia sp. S19_KUP03_FR1]|uniref:sensor histidine kinase n=1 Tax=Massilia sp. S19_KUP03_FR1 TaxID=3025503 RepID=UPI002FCDAB37